MGLRRSAFDDTTLLRSAPRWSRDGAFLVEEHLSFRHHQTDKLWRSTLGSIFKPPQNERLAQQPFKT